jgi:hypothetical protein
VEATQRFWDAAIKVPECPYPPTPHAEHPITDNPDYWYRQSGPEKFKSTYLKVWAARPGIGSAPVCVSFRTTFA